MTDRWWQEIEERAPEPEEFERRASAGPSQLSEAVVQYGSPGAGSAVLEAVFAQRALRALQEIAHEVSAESLSTVVSAPTDLDVLLEILLRPEARLPSRDPFTAARLRGVQASRRLLDAEGGTLSAEEVGEVLGISRQAVNQRRQKGQLLALSVGRHGYAYPAWQLGREGTLEGLPEVLELLSEEDPWMQARFFLTPSPRLDDARPLDLLREGRVNEVLEAARSYGEHGAA
jgi:biotin operon repressor